ncbi:MAG: transcription antitermination factor NusB [Clostridiales bacterium]|nr:transcription antitermination factor NusB [Clostridia bacterium]MCR5352823.1 transcription antitermination factor NusB [Clostridiales bacterium]
MKRRQAREAVLCMLFDYGFHTEEKPEELLELYLDYFYDKKEENISEEIRLDDYFSKVYFGVIANIAEIDGIIEKCSQKWSKKRISRISLSAIRIAIYEMLYMSGEKDGISPEISINEAVELVKKYDSEDSYTFVNGVLGAAYRLIKEQKSAAE